jgi:hypothetical protein
MAILFERKYFTHLQLDAKVSEKDVASLEEAVLSISTVNCIVNLKTLATTKKIIFKIAKLAYLHAINNCDSHICVCNEMSTEKKGLCQISNTRLGSTDINLHYTCNFQLVLKFYVSVTFCCHAGNELLAF